MRRTALATLSLLALTAAPAAAGPRVFKADPSECRASFTLTSALNDIVGESRAVRAVASFDPKKRESAQVEASVEWSTVTTGIQKRDEHLRSADFIDAARFPQATFKSTAVRLASWPPRTGTPASVIFEGVFEVHGVSRPVQGEAEASMIDDATLNVQATFTIDLTDYDIEVPRFLGLFPYDSEATVNVTLLLRDAKASP